MLKFALGSAMPLFRVRTHDLAAPAPGPAEPASPTARLREQATGRHWERG